VRLGLKTRSFYFRTGVTHVLAKFPTEAHPNIVSAPLNEIEIEGAAKVLDQYSRPSMHKLMSKSARLKEGKQAISDASQRTGNAMAVQSAGIKA
jgi:hypothetical protein